jgi:hypothetical protein
VASNEFDGAERLRELVTLNTRLQRQLRQAKDRESNLVAAVMQGAREGFLMAGPMPKVKGPKSDDRTHSPEVALWDFGDWQGGKKTTTYNTEVMRERVMRYCDIAERITVIHRADHPVRDAVVIFGGDQVEGLFNFPTQPFEVDSTIFEQYANVSRLLIEVVRRALAVYENVRVVAEYGNHGRIGSKRDAIPRGDNTDRMCYEFARTMLAGEDRLVWPDCPEDIQRLEIGNYRALVLHGDEVGRNGYASPMTMVTHIAKWQSGAYPWQFRDAFVHHYHVHQEFSLPNGLGSVYYNGSTESSNRYALEQMASSATPSQRLHFIDPDEGRTTSVHKIWLA